MMGKEMIDSRRVDACLKHWMPSLTGRPEIQPATGGQSNPTYFVTYEHRRLVLRKQPQGELLPSAHAIDREFRVLSALADSQVPVPRPIFFHKDHDVVGTPFYVMERIDGRVFHDAILPGIGATERAAMYDSVNAVLAKLHLVDWKACGLETLGKRGDYYGRQLRRWTQQWLSSQTRDIPSLDRLVEWLPGNIPPSDDTAICHGDYRFGNIIFHPTEPRVIGVLDWELSTLGHPLADLAFNCILYHTTALEYGGILGRYTPGIPPEPEYIRRYCDRTGRADGITNFHLAFALFRFAVIFEGIAARAAQGNAAAGANADKVKHLSSVFARRACELAGLN